MISDLIYGKNPLTNIVSIEPGDSTAEIYTETAAGVQKTTVPISHYIILNENLNPKFTPLKGDQFYKYIMHYDSIERYEKAVKHCYRERYDFFRIHNTKEAMMVKDGYTYYKGMQLNEVSVLSFDIETNGLKQNSDSKVFLISNAFRKNGKVTRKLFSLDEYPGQKEMLLEWVKWVQKMNPSIIVGHNIFSFDLPYLQNVAENNRIEIRLGRDHSGLKFADRTSQFRKDGSQSYDYHNCLIYGREIVDTYFLAMKYDVGRNYDSYSLKQIIKQEGLEKKGRTFIDASKISKLWDSNDMTQRELIKKYAIEDADDALKLFDLMIPSFFYLAQSTPRSFQQIINSASGSQINGLMVRAYLQHGYSIAKASDKKDYLGAISFGNPGLHKHVFTIDVQSLYPNIILSKQICNRSKDPQEVFLQLVKYFTEERVKNKDLYDKTKDRYYKDLSESQKIVINSMYGFLGTNKLNYNSPDDAALVTQVGREILKKAIYFISGKEYIEQLSEGDEDEAA